MELAQKSLTITRPKNISNLSENPRFATSILTAKFTKWRAQPSVITEFR